MSKNYGGSRKGAGRPRKWRFQDILTVGQACEVKWREASDRVVDARFNALPFTTEIHDLQEAAQAIDVSQRKAWTESDGYEDHAADLEGWFHARAGTKFDEKAGVYEEEVSRIATVSRKPPRGTRKAIIAVVARQFALSESQVDNLWQAYRRFELETQPSDGT